MPPRKRIRGLISAGRSRRRVTAALALAVAIGVVIAVVLADQSPSVSNAASNGGQGSGTATVQRRDLVQTDTESGTLSYGNTRTVYNRLSGTITWLPAVGQVIEPGQALYKVAGKPAILMDGTTPAYRDLKASDGPGQDVLQLNRDLVALDFNRSGIVVDDQWQPGTTVGVELFQESLGESPTGTLTLGQIVFLPGNQLVSGVSANLGADGASGGSGTPAAYRIPGAPTPQFVSLTTTTSTTPTSTTPTTSTTPPTSTTPRSTGHKPSKGSSGGPQSATTVAALIALLRAESAQLRAESQALRAAQGANRPGSSGSPGAGNNANNNSHNNSSNNNNSNASNNGANGNGGGGSASAILETSSTQLVVTVDLDATKQSEAKVGERVTVQMPGGNTVNGTITAVSPVAQSSSGNGGSGGGNGGNGNGSSPTATIPVTITLSGHPRGAGLDQAAVSVNFAQARARNVLSVPVTALLATGGGAYAVREAATPRSLIPVTTGLFAAGYVQISGPGISQGLQVTDSQG